MRIFFGGKVIHVCMPLVLVLSWAFTLSCSAGEKMVGSSAAPSEKSGQGVSLRVLWTVSSYHRLSTATMHEDDARAMLFKPLDISATAITFAGQTCRDVVSTSESIDAENYLRKRFQVTPQALGLEEKMLTVVRTTCRIPGFGEYVRLRDRRLLVPMQGVLFVFSPVVNY